jgi:hypothetical protein
VVTEQTRLRTRDRARYVPDQSAKPQATTVTQGQVSTAYNLRTTFDPTGAEAGEMTRAGAAIEARP